MYTHLQTKYTNYTHTCTNIYTAYNTWNNEFHQTWEITIHFSIIFSDVQAEGLDITLKGDMNTLLHQVNSLCRSDD